MIRFVRTQNTGKSFFAVKRNPRKLTAVVVKKSGRKANPSACRNIGKRCIVVGAVEIRDFAGADQPVLNSLQRRRRTAADHQRSSVKVAFGDQILLGERIIPAGYQIDPAFKQFVCFDIRYLFCLFFEGKYNIRLVFQKAFHSVFITELRCDQHIGMNLSKLTPLPLRSKIVKPTSSSNSLI